MAESFAKEIKWWKSRAAEFDTKRARLQPLSYTYASQAYASRGNYNGAASLDSMRLDIYRKADEESASLRSRIENGTYVKPLTAAQKKAAAATKPALPNTVVKPSESVSDLEDQVAKLQRKIKGIGGDVTRSLVGGFSRAMDVISRLDYAAQEIRSDAITDAKASGGNITIGEHLQIAAKPFLFMTPASGFIATAAILGNDSAKDMYSDGWAGLSGKKKTVGIDNIRAEYPNWSAQHNVAANVLGFASDIASDPTTYLTMGSGTAVKTGGAVGAKLIGQKALARSLADETIWTKAGRAAGTQTLKDNVRAGKTLKASKEASKAAKTAHKAGKKVEKATDKFNRGKITEEGLDSLKKRLGAAEGHKAIAAAEYSRVHELAFADELRGFGDVAQYLIKHPFKSVGSYGQGLRAGSVSAGNKTAQAIHDGVKADFVNTITDIPDVPDAVSAMHSMQLHTRIFHNQNKGKTLQVGNKTFDVADDYNQFAKDVADRLFKFIPVTQLTSRAARGRYSVLGQAKAERNEFINMLITKGDANFVELRQYADNILQSASPVGKKSAAVKAATATPTVPEEAMIAPSIRRAADATLQADVDRAVDAILASRTLRESMMMDLFDARPPELAIMDEANGINPDHVAAREYFKSIARQKMDEYGVPLDEAGRVVAPETRAKGDFAATGGVHQVNYAAKRDRAIAEALSDAMEQAVRDIAMHNVLNDPDIIVKGYVDAAHEMINKVSADTHVQVMEFLRYKHGLSMPSMNLPRQHVDELYASGDIWDGIPSPQFAEKHYAGYLKDQIAKTIGWGAPTYTDNDFYQMLDALDLEKGIFARGENKNIFNGTIEEPGGLWGRLKDASLELSRLHYTPEGTKNAAAVDKYTLMDHMVFGRGATEELKIGVGGTDPKIGRATFASDSINTNGIPAYNPQLLDDLATFDQMEKKAVEGYANWDKIGYPEGFTPKTVDEVHEMFNGMRRALVQDDFAYILDGANGVKPQAMLHSLGSHLDLLHNTTEYGNFSVKWRRQMASNLWGIPAEKGAAKNGTKFFKEGKWTSASLMADLNDAISLGILEKTLKYKMRPEQVADWLASTTRDNPVLEMIMKDADLQYVRGGKTGAGASNVVNVTTTAKAQKLADARGQDLNPFSALDAEEARDAAAMQAAADPLNPTSAESIAPGGHAAPSLDPENIKHIQAFIDKRYDDVDVVTLGKLMEDMRSNQIYQIAFYDQKMQEALGGMQLQNSMQIRVMGMPVVSIPAANNPMHTNAGVLAMNQDLPKHINARSKVDIDGNAARIAGQKWLTRPRSKLDEGMRQIMTHWSGQSTFHLKALMDNVKVTYRAFKNKAELHAATRDYFTLGTHAIDPRLVETQNRFNDVHNFVMEHADTFTGKNLGYDSNFVKGSVASLMAGLPNEFRIDQSVMRSFESMEPLFTREWFVALSKHLSSQTGATKVHPLSATEITKLDMARFEFGFHHTAAKLRVKNNTARQMFETFSAAMRSDVVKATNDLDGMAGSRNQFVLIDDFFGGGVVPDDLRGRYVNQHIAEEMQKVLNFVEESMDNHRQKINFGYMRDINNMWKGGVTVFSARYHVGNIMSDGFMNLIDGVRPASYKKAMNTIVTDPDTVSLYSDPAFMEGLNTVLAKADVLPEDVPVMQSTIEYIQSHGHSRPISRVNIEGKPVTVTSAEYQLRYRGYGLDQNNVTGNLSKGTENMVSPGISQASNISDIVQNLSAKREDYFRMSHFIHAFEQEARVPGRTLDDAWLAARDRVVQWHFDYDDVTEFERNYIAPVAPFYKWTRNIVPLSFSVFFTNPKAYTIGNAANRAMGEAMFPTQEDAEGNEIPLDLVIPRWIPEQGAVPMEVYLDDEGNEQMRYAVLNLPFDQAMVKWFSPFTDAATDPEAPMSDKLIRRPGQALAGSAGSMIHPVLGTAIAAGTGVVPIAGGTIPQEDWWNPLLNMFYSGTGAIGEAAKLGSQVAKGKDTPTTFAGDVGALRVRSVTEGQKKGELLRQEDRLEAILKKKTAPQWMAKNHPGVDPNSEQGKEILHDYFVSIGVLQK
jgi:hypothetical protein